jgi:hypothetical protein
MIPHSKGKEANFIEISVPLINIYVYCIFKYPSQVPSRNLIDATSKKRVQDLLYFLP